MNPSPTKEKTTEALPGAGASSLGRTELEPFLLALHRTVSPDDFWVALQSLLDAALPNQSVIAALRVAADGPPFFYHTHKRSHHTHGWFSQTLAAHPCYAHLMANPGMPVLRLSEVLTPGTIDSHPFYHEFMKPEGWRHGMAFVYWKDGQIDALIPVNRSPNQPDFSAEEFQLAQWLHPQIEAALRRVMEILSLAEAHQSLVSYLTDLPLPTLRLNWDCRLVYANRSARTLLTQWENLRAGGPSRRAGSRVKIPCEILDACAMVKQALLSMDHACWPPPLLPAPVHLSHPADVGFTAVIRTTRYGNRPLSNPGFWIHLEQSRSESAAPGSLTAMRLLSKSERAVAELLLLGLGNQEIATRLGRSISTVKAHLQSAFRKLGVNNRTSMFAKLRTPGK